MCMEVNTQINFNGYRADYKVVSLNAVYYQAVLLSFSGITSENPPPQINFVNDNNRAIASSDVIKIARELLIQLRPKSINY